VTRPLPLFVRAWGDDRQQSRRRPAVARAQLSERAFSGSLDQRSNTAPGPAPMPSRCSRRMAAAAAAPPCVRLLGGGAPVTSAALDAGCSSAGAFIAVFKKMFGTPPGRYSAA